MKKPLLLFVLLLGGTLAGAQEKNAHRIQVVLGLSTGSLINGFQYDLLHDDITPQPYQYSFVAPSVGIRHYVLPNWGLESIPREQSSTK